MTTLKFNLKYGMDSFLRVMGMLRRKGVNPDNIEFAGKLLIISVAVETVAIVLSNLGKLADVVYLG